jgi:hypothetical protein
LVFLPGRAKPLWHVLKIEALEGHQATGQGRPVPARSSAIGTGPAQYQGVRRGLGCGRAVGATHQPPSSCRESETTLPEGDNAFRREDRTQFQMWVTTFKIRDHQFVITSVPLR